MKEIGTGAIVVATLALASTVACRNRSEAIPSSTSSATRAPIVSAAPAPSASAPTPPATPAPEALEEKALESALERWNAATNAADRSGLEAMYAKNLTLYERIVTRGAAVKAKLDYVAKHPGFSQKLESPSWSESAEHRIARFRKTWQSQGAAPGSVDAYLVFKQDDGAWRIIDEGDVQTARKMSAKIDTFRKNWKERVWDCPLCSDPELGDDPPSAGPPLGPDRVKASGALPPGAPESIEYGRAYFPRFASAVDVPLFLTATPQSTNGDGRWFYYDAPGADAGAAAGETKHLLECAIGGHFSYGNVPANAKPDPGHVGDPKVTTTTRLEKRNGVLSYERYIYAADGVMNFVLCTFDPTYEGYFYAIVQRMGRSMRAISGGQVGRVVRVSQPYTAE
ncbi:hypothetical protein [Sorangium sp. So ce145]|uniref:hypothetical protein n=1 Tax=Sorangium sp. So ce145 TaxID=3133285 RepID=UPI003F648F4F